MRTGLAVLAVLGLVLGSLYYVGIHRPKQAQRAKVARAAAVVERYRADVVARDADLQAIARTLATLEHHDAEPPLPEGTPYAIVMTGFLRTRAGLPPLASEPSLSSRIYLDQATSLVETGRRFAYDDGSNDDAAMAERMLAPVATLRYALLVDTLVYRAPVAGRDDTFTMGTWTANAYFVDVPARRYIAGWTVSANSSATVRQGGISQGSIALDDDLAKQIEQSLASGVRRHVNGLGW